MGKEKKLVRALEAGLVQGNLSFAGNWNQHRVRALAQVVDRKGLPKPANLMYVKSVKVKM